MIRKCAGIIAVLMVAAPVCADSTLQIWTCKLNDGKTGQELMAASKDWLAAAKSMDGGENFEVTLEFPIAANAGDGEFNFVLIAENVEDWGRFTNAYQGSPAAEADEAWGEVATCKRSGLWSSVDVE